MAIVAWPRRSVHVRSATTQAGVNVLARFKLASAASPGRDRRSYVT